MRGWIGRLFVAAALVSMTMGPGAPTALACISESPSFAQVVARAETIARVTIVDGTDYDGAPDDLEAFRVERVLKGNPGPRIELVNPMSGLCGDRIGSMTSDHGNGVGQTIILATGVEFFDKVIHPFWHVGAGGVGGSAGWPAAAATLEELEAAIAAAVRVPDTATAATDVAPATAAVGPEVVILIAVVMVLSGLMVRRRFPSAGHRVERHP